MGLYAHTVAHRLLLLLVVKGFIVGDYGDKLCKEQVVVVIV